MQRPYPQPCNATLGLGERALARFYGQGPLRVLSDREANRVPIKSAGLIETQQAGAVRLGREAGMRSYHSEMVRVGEESPPSGGGEHVVGRQRVACEVPVGVQRVPAHGRERGPLTKLTGVDLDR